MPNSHAVRMAQVRFGSLYFRSCPLSNFLARRRRDKPSNQGIQPTIAFDAAFEGDRSVGPLSTSGAPPVSIQRKLDAPCSASLRKAGHQAGKIARAGRPEPALVRGASGDWEIVVVGLEVHAQVASNAKLFSSSSTEFGAEPNSNVDFIDAAMPGMLPVINEFCVEQAVKTGLGLKAKINPRSSFDRKNYFYPDLPQGYQISQLYHPIVGAGEVIVETDPGIARRVRIDHIHLEQDAGKSLHDMDANHSFVDLNRSGVALMEIVSLP